MLKKIALTSIILLGMTGCSITDEIPSFHDDNENTAIIDVVYAIHKLDCNSQFAKQHVTRIYNKTTWLKFYIQYNGSKDVEKLIGPFEKTLAGLYDKPNASVKYCELKRKSLFKQSEDIAKAIMGRY